jgi:hypothetical protein
LPGSAQEWQELEVTLPSSIPDLYRTLIEAQRATAEACFQDEEALATFTRCHNFLSDLSLMRKLLAARPEAACLDVAIQEYQYGLSALALGHYRHAFGSLRLAFELMLSTVYFSAHEVKLRQWLNGTRDITWAGLSDEDKGVFSQPFVAAFYPRLVELRRRFAGLAATVYRECSEFVHGNPKTHGDLAGEVRFRKEVLSSWGEKLESIRLCVLFCFLYRYGPFLNAEAKGRLEPVMLEAMGHEGVVQDFFQEQ